MKHEISTEWIDLTVNDGDGTSVMAGYLARPAAPGPHPNVLVGFEMFGVTGYIRGVVQRLARLGYSALAPDFYHRLGDRVELSADAEGRERGFKLLTGIHRDGVRQDVQAAIAYLAGQPGGSNRTAMLGLSVGGHIAYYAATQLPLAALIVCYPGWLTGTDIPLSQPEPTLALTPRIADLGTPVLFLVGDQDHLVTTEQRGLIAGQLDGAGVQHEMIVYPDTPHGFLCQERDTYRPAAAEDAWSHITALLSGTLVPA